MKIQFNTDRNIVGNEKLEAYVNSLIASNLDRFSNYITRIEVHLSDENGGKNGQNDKRCTLEARIENKQPIAVTCDANTLEEATSDAIKKLKASLETIIGILKNH